MIEFPSSLPSPDQAPLQPSETRAIAPGAGPFDTRPLSADPHATQTLIWTLDGDEAGAWWAFYRDDLDEGSRWFAAGWPHPDGQPQHVYRFSSARQESLSEHVRRITAEVVVRGASEVDGLTLPTIYVQGSAVLESAQHVTWAVMLSPPPLASVGLSLALSGTATAGDDYEATIETSPDGIAWTAGSSVTLAAGAATLLARVPVLQDALTEPDETVRLTVTRTSGATANASAFADSVILGAGLPTISVADISVAEDAGAAVFEVTLSAASASPITCDWSTQAGTATAGVDYLDGAGSITWQPGETVRLVTVTILSDGMAEGAEEFALALTGATGATIADGLAVCTIQASSGSAGGLPTVSVNDQTAAEGGAATFTVTLSAASASAVTVGYSTQDVTALAGTDYTATSGTLTFDPGQTTKTVTVPVLSDGIAEPAETFRLVLSGVVGCTIADGIGVCTIPGVPTISIASTSVLETAGNAVLTISLSAVAADTVTVFWATSDGTAVAPSDYTASSGTATIASGQTSTTISVPIVADTAAEGTETFTVTLSLPTNAALGAATATVSILQVTAATANPFDVHVFVPGTMSADQIVLRVPLARDVSWPANFSGSAAHAKTAATAATSFAVFAGLQTVGASGPGAQIGTIAFAAGAATATFSTVGGAAQSLLAGRVLSILGPASADATLADIGIVLAGTRT